MLKEAIAHATVPVKIVLSILIISSTLVWALIIYNLIMFKKIEEKDFEFLDSFWDVRNIGTFYRYDDFHPSVIAKMCAEVAAILSKKKIPIERIGRVIEQEAKNALAEVSRFQFIFATVASTAPFVGLFGTVWGIMHSFHEIGKTGKAGLEVVAPGISEALFATAVGLFAAIPAVVAFNFFQNKIKKIANRLEFFATELENHILRRGDEKMLKENHENENSMPKEREKKIKIKMSEENNKKIKEKMEELKSITE